MANTERRGIFLRKSELAELRDEIRRLKGTYTLDVAQQARLSELTHMTRRDFIRKSAAIFGVTSATGMAAYLGLRPEEKQRFVSAEPPDEPLHTQPKHPEAKPPEQLEGTRRIQYLVSEYNRWFRTVSPEIVARPGAAIKVFVSIYNEMRSRTPVPDELPALTPEDFHSTAILTKLATIEQALTTPDYFVTIKPTGITTADAHISYVSIISGKITSQSAKTVKRDGQTKPYNHLVLDKAKSSDDDGQYATEISWVSAFTQRTSSDQPHDVIQLHWRYQQSAQARYEMMQQRHSESDQANYYVLSDYLKLPRAEAIEQITDRVEQNSLLHEEQHVFDNTPSDMEQFDLSVETAVAHRVVGESRALLAALTAADPKMGVLNIYMWLNSPDRISALIGKATAGTLAKASGYTLDELLKLSDSDINRIARNTLQVSDIIFEGLTVQMLSADDSRLQEIDQQYMEQLELLKQQEQQRRQ